MDDLLLLSEAQLRRIEPCFPLSHPMARVDDRRVLSGSGRPVRLVLIQGQTSGCTGGAMLVDTLPTAKAMLADRGYDAAWFRTAPADRGITAYIRLEMPIDLQP